MRREKEVQRVKAYDMEVDEVEKRIDKLKLVYSFEPQKRVNRV